MMTFRFRILAILVLLMSFSWAEEGVLWIGVSPRGGEKGPAELVKWEGEGDDLPADWKGAPTDLIGISLGGAHSWGSIAEYGVNFYEEQRGWKGFARKDRMEIAVPMYLTNLKMSEKEWTIALRNKIPNPMINRDPKASDWERYSEGGQPYLSYYRLLAENLVKHGYGNAILRLGWEFDGDWFPWGSHLEPFELDGELYDHPRAYKELYQKIHGVMVSVAGAKFRWSWNSSIGALGFVNKDGKPHDYRMYFPGKDCVDFVSVDNFDDEVRFYPWKGNEEDEFSQEINLRLTWLSHLLRVEGIETSLALLLESLEVDLKGKYAFAASDFPREHFDVLTKEKFPSLASLRTYVLEKNVAKAGRPGMQWFRDFAKENEMGFILSEWGVWENNPLEEPRYHYSGGDNAEYIRLIHGWLQKNRIPGQVVGAVYFEEYNPAVKDAEGFNHSLLQSFPKARREYTRLFGPETRFKGRQRDN